MSPVYPLILLSFALTLTIAESATMLRLQNEIDQIDLEALFTNEKLLAEQLDCLLEDEPCNIVGRWLKPRLRKAFLGECPLCTPKQSNQLIQGLKELRQHDPSHFHDLANKYLEF